MFANHLARLFVLIAVAISTCSAVRAEVEPMLSLMPDDAVAFVAVPELRRLNDAIAHTLDGMDRSTAIFGSRPIDAIKSMSGLSVAVHERRPAAAVFMPRRDEEPGVEIVWLVPVTIAENFLSGNFRRINEERAADGVVHINHRRFGELFARPLDGHVALSKNRAVLEHWNVSDDGANGWRTRIDDDGRRVMRSGDIIVWVSGWTCEKWGRSIADSFDWFAARLPAIGPLRSIAAALISDEFVDTVVAIDLDPLGVFVRMHCRVEADGELDWPIEAKEPQHLRSLPLEPYQFALAMDGRGMMMSRLFAQRLGWDRLAQSLKPLGEIRQFDFAAYAGSPAGVLGRAIAVGESAEANTSVSLALTMLPWQHAGSDRIWREAQVVPLREEMRAHQYDVRLDGAASVSDMLSPLLFGPAGWQGYVISEGNRAAMTFSRARSSQEMAINAIDASGSSLADDPIVRSMMNWMPDRPALIGFTNVGALMDQFKPMMQPMLAMMEMRMPDVAPGLPPVAFAAAMEGNSIEATIIIPAGVLAIGYDLAGAQFIRQRFLTPRDDRDRVDE